MDDLKIVFWILLGLIYIFARKKKKDTPAPSRTQRREAGGDAGTDSPVPGPKSFEELLREIQEMKAPAKEPTPVTTYDRPPVKRVPEYVDYDDEIEEEKTSQEEKPYDYRQQDKIYQVYEDAKNLAFERPSLEETIKLEDTIVRFKQFKGYEIGAKPHIAEGIMKDLKDPQGFKKAFLLSEILNRRHF